MNNIPEAGRERDKLIARLKYPKVKFIINDPIDDSNFVFYIPSGKPYKTHAIDYKYLPDWSINLLDTWELWDELPQIKTITMRDNKYFIQYGVPDNPADLIYHPGIEGISLSDAVSKAWISWKNINEDK
jgi:hypothetical protein